MQYSNNTGACDGMNFVKRSTRRGKWKGSLTESEWLNIKTLSIEMLSWRGKYIQQELFHLSNMHYNIITEDSWATVKVQQWEKLSLIEAGTGKCSW